MAQQINIFIAYSRTDTAYLQKIKKYLKVFERRKEITIWYDGEIVAGEFWNKSITKKLESADMILLLVSADSLASDYFHQKEMLKALERHLVEVLVVPIILKDCLWEDDLGDIQVLPKDGVPIVKWKYESEAYTNIARGVKASIIDAKKMKQNRLKKLEEEYNDELKATKKQLEDTEVILKNVKNDLTKKEKVVEYLKHQIVEQDALFKKNEKGLKASLKQSETEKQVLKQHILEREKAVKVLETEKNKLLKKIKSFLKNIY